MHAGAFGSGAIGTVSGASAVHPPTLFDDLEGAVERVVNTALRVEERVAALVGQMPPMPLSVDVKGSNRALDHNSALGRVETAVANISDATDRIRDALARLEQHVPPLR